MGKLINHKQVVRPHGLRKGDQLKLKGDIWWVVERQVDAGTTLTIHQKQGHDKEITVPDWGISIVASRGSRVDVFTFRAEAVIRIIRQKEKVGT